MQHKETRIQGFPVSEGIAIGVPYFLPSLEQEIPEFPIALCEVDQEIDRYRTALFSSRQDLQAIHSNLVVEGSKDAATIIDTHIQMLEDPLMTTHMESKIRNMLQNTESVFHSVISDYETRFSKNTDVFFQEKLTDVMDLAKRVLGHLHPTQYESYEDIPSNSIVFAKNLTPSYIATADASQIAAFVTHSGGIHSHPALIARAKKMPYVDGINIAEVQNISAKCVIVDGKTGEIIFNPTVQTLNQYKQKKTCFKTSQQLLQKECQYDTETIDGCQVQIFANVGNVEDLDNLESLGAEGIGLFRTEYLFFQRKELFSSEEDQYHAYVELIQKAGDMSIVIRVFDFGGDKNPELFSNEQKEPNPVLGCRGIRFLLRHQEIFKTQIRAVLRAAIYGNVRLLLPLISDVNELKIAKQLIFDVAASLKAEGVAFKENVPIGCMIEVPSAVLICDALAEQSDFLSIGTNDLVQYTLGIDRSNPAMSDFCYPAHPSVIRMIKMVCIEAKRRGKTVSICGEIASNPQFIPLLLGLGINQFSCSPRYIPLVKRAVRQTTLLQAFALAERVLSLNSSEEISQLLMEAFPTSVAQ